MELPDYPPEVQAVRRERLAKGQPPLYEMSVEQAREADLEALREESAPGEPVARIVETEYEGGDGNPLPARLYAPERERPPLLVYFYGGGWVVGELDTADRIARSLVNQADIAVLVCSYRLAPEHPFPAAAGDAFAALRGAAASAERLGVDPERLAVGGDSAGGNLAAAAAQLARDEGGPRLAFQLLVYPVMQHGADGPSTREVIDTAFFNPRSMAWYWGHYLEAPEHGRDPRASPLLAERFEDLPPALIITAEHDPLRDEGEEYGRRINEAGVPAKVSRYDGMVHGFFAMTAELTAGREAQAEAAAALREALG